MDDQIRKYFEEMSSSGIKDVGWKHLEKEREHVWISQKGEGSQMSGNARYTTIVHYFKNPGGQIQLPYVMVNLETHPGFGVFDGGTYQYFFYFFHPDGSGRFVNGEGSAWGEPGGLSSDEDDFNIEGIIVQSGWNINYTPQVRQEVAKLPDRCVLATVQGFLKDSQPMSPEEIAKILEGEKSLTHRYNRDSIFYPQLMERQTEEAAKQYGFFGFRRELSDKLCKLVEQDRLE